MNGGADVNLKPDTHTRVPAENRSNFVLFRQNESLSALIAAVHWDHLACVTTPINAGANVNVNVGMHNNSTVLHQAARNGQLKIVNVLIEAGADIIARENSGATPLITAAGGGLYESRELLIKAGADVNTICKRGDNVLISAARSGCERCVNLLIKSGADVNVQSKPTKNMFRGSDNHDTALIAAVNDANYKCATSLLKAGAEVNLRDNENSTTLIRAIDNMDYVCSKTF